MYSLNIDASLDRAISDLDALIAGMNAPAIREVAGVAAAQVVRDHFYDLATARHRPEADFNFWEEAADAAIHRVSDDGVEVIVDQVGVAQRRYGGRIEPVNSSHLWIPVHPDAIGHTPGDFDFDDILVIISPRTGQGVAKRKSSGGSAKRDARGRFRARTSTAGDVLFALVTEVNQDPDPSVDPDPAVLLAAVGAAQLEWLAARIMQ
jgi:hypothetical protein